MTPGTLETDAAKLEGYHGMLAQERRIARMVLMDAHRTPRTSRFNTIMSVGNNLKQLPATNIPLHRVVYNVTKESHSYIDKEVMRVEKEQQEKIADYLEELHSKLNDIFNQFIPEAIKTTDAFTELVATAVYPDTVVEKYYLSEANRGHRLQEILNEIDVLDEAEAINVFQTQYASEINQLYASETSAVYDVNWRHAFGQAIRDETRSRKPIYDILIHGLSRDNNALFISELNANLSAQEPLWQAQIKKFHDIPIPALDYQAAVLDEPQVVSDVITKTNNYKRQESLPSLIQDIIDLLEAVLSYLQFLYPFLRQNNMLALLLLSIALLIITALLLCPPAFYIRCKLKQYLVQQKIFENYRVKASRQRNNYVF